MKAVILFLALVLSVFGQDFYCSYETYDQSQNDTWGSVMYYYDISDLSLEVGETSYGLDDIEHATFWIFNLCGSLDGLVNYFGIDSSCAAGSAACFQNSLSKSENWTSAGSANSIIFGDSMYGVDQGLSLTYFTGDLCESPSGGYAYRQVRFELVCDPNTDGISTFGNTVITDDCYDTIIVNTSSACPDVDTESGEPSDSGFGDSGMYYEPRHFSFFMWMYGPISAFALLCCICCARICARRRQQCKRQNAKIYEPVPQVVPVAPQGNPNMIPLQNFVPQYYYYPVPAAPQPAPVATPKAAPRDEQLNNDEALAKALQAQFDQEVAH